MDVFLGSTFLRMNTCYQNNWSIGMAPCIYNYILQQMVFYEKYIIFIDGFQPIIANYM